MTAAGGVALSPPRWMRLAWLVLAVAGAVFITVLTRASANTALFTRYYTELLVANVLIVAGLAALVIYQVVLLLRARRAAVFGAKLTTRMMMFFAVVAVLPGALVYGISVQFLASSVESYFDTRIDKALESGLQLGRTALSQPLKELSRKAETMAGALAMREPAEVRAALLTLREQNDVTSAALLTGSGNLIAQATEKVAAPPPSPLGAMELRQLRAMQTVTSVEPVGDAGLQLKVLVPVRSADGSPPRVLLVNQPVPAALRDQTERVEAGFRDYQELSYQRVSLKRLFALTLTLALLLALLTALALATVFSERLAQPLARLADGTRAVADGDFSRRQPVEGRDELSVLTQSFNTMTAQLAEARDRDLANRREIETSNLYLENILKNLNTGVLVMTDAFVLRVANAAASVVLQARVDERVGEALSAWSGTEPGLTHFAEIVARNFAQAGDDDWHREQELMVGGNARTFILRGARRVVADVAARIVVFDDITEVLQAQRDTAWAEVARRLAHEIKNPLTPIQLSAERLEMKLAPRLTDADTETLRKGTQTIVNQVTAMKNMVNDFAIYARRPRPGSLQPVDVEALIRETLELYASYPVQLALDWQASARVIRGEGTRLRQVIHNLLQNAVDACTERSDGSVRVEAVSRDIIGHPGEQELLLRFCDNGAGFSDAVKQRAFEPYVTTKPKGTGLGLAIVKKIIDEHKGRISLDNAASGGAVVTVIFPLLAEENTDR
ncbi:MAG: HAMP domain-containing protein [Burkholderiales bacterium]|nr:HAMP domain-containing protein [Burkholderiales bacterium]